MLNNKTINKMKDTLEVAKEEIEQAEVIEILEQDQEIKHVQNNERIKDIDDDYKKTRAMLNKLASQGQTAITELLKIAKDSNEPRAYEVLSQLIKTTTEVTKEFLETQKNIKNVEGTSENTPHSLIQNNKNIFIGTTNELQELWEEQYGRGKISPKKIQEKSETT